MAGTCKRFKQIASNLFIKKFQHFDIDKVKRHSPSLVNNGAISLEVFNGIYREFGRFIKDFSVRLMQDEGKTYSKITINAVATYRGEEKSLLLGLMEINAELLAILDPVFKKLNSLHLKECKLDPLVILNQYPNNKQLILHDMEISNANFFNQCNQLKQLTLIRAKLNAEIWDQRFPKLIHFYLNGEEDSVQVEEITNFFRKNPQLKYIGIYHCKNLDVSTLVSIGKYLPNITSLTWASDKIDSPIDLWQMPKLNQLSTLDLHCGLKMSLLVNALLPENNCLQRLRFEECIFDKEFEESVIKLHHLKELTLLNCLELSNEKMDSLFTQLKHLDRFTLHADEYTIRDMHQLLRSMSHVKKLSVYIRHEDTIQIDEYKMWMTEIQRRMDHGSLWIKVTETCVHRLIKKELSLFKKKIKLNMFISVDL